MPSHNGEPHDYERYDHAFEHVANKPDHVPDLTRDLRRTARAYGNAPDDAGGFGPSTQGPYGQSAYGRGVYDNRYVPGNNHPYADRAAHNQYNAEHFGPHRGKGPKAFTRTDERLKEHVSELLMEHGEIDATHVVVEVKNGEVSLSGLVEDRFQRRAIEDMVESIYGVKDVHLTLKIANRK